MAQDINYGWKQNEIAHHDLIAQEYDETTMKSYSFFDPIIEKKIDKFRKRNAKFILDCGCGTGRATLLAQNRGFSGVVSLDISFEMLKCLKAKLQRSWLGAKTYLVVGDAENLPFKNGFFDGIISLGLLHHIPSINKAINEQARTLKNNGLLIIGDLNNEISLFSWVMNALIYIFFHIIQIIFKKMHIMLYSTGVSSATERDINARDVLIELDKFHFNHSSRYFMHNYILDRYLPRYASKTIFYFLNKFNYAKKGDIFLIEAQR